MDYEEFTNVTARERELEMSTAFPVLMRKVYLWMTLALVITMARLAVSQSWLSRRG